MNCTRFIGRLASIAGILVFSSVVAFGQPATSGSEQEPHHAAAPSQGMGMGMMGDQGMMGPGMMGGPGGMMDMQMMQTMMNDPKTRGQMMEIHGRMMKEMGALMEKRGQELEQSK
jgi:hypothetical protein